MRAYTVKYIILGNERWDWSKATRMYDITQVLTFTFYSYNLNLKVLADRKKLKVTHGS